MVEISVKVPDDLSEDMQKLHIDVSRAVAEAIKNEIVRVVALKAISSRSMLTEEDALKLGKKLKSGRFKELQKEGKV